MEELILEVRKQYGRIKCTRHKSLLVVGQKISGYRDRQTDAWWPLKTKGLEDNDDEIGKICRVTMDA